MLFLHLLQYKNLQGHVDGTAQVSYRPAVVPVTQQRALIPTMELHLLASSFFLHPLASVLQTGARGLTPVLSQKMKISTTHTHTTV